MMIKQADATAFWMIYDNVRSPVNPATAQLKADVTDAGTTVSGVSFDSTGFTVSGHSTLTGAGHVYIYVAIRA